MLHLKHAVYRLLEIIIWEINKEQWVMKATKEPESDSRVNYTEKIKQTPRLHL